MVDRQGSVRRRATASRVRRRCPAKTRLRMPPADLHRRRRHRMRQADAPRPNGGQAKQDLQLYDRVARHQETIPATRCAAEFSSGGCETRSFIRAIMPSTLPAAIFVPQGHRGASPASRLSPYSKGVRLRSGQGVAKAREPTNSVLTSARQGGLPPLPTRSPIVYGRAINRGSANPGAMPRARDRHADADAVIAKPRAAFCASARTPR